MHILAPSGSVESYPYSVRQLRKDNPQVSFPADMGPDLLAEYGVFSVTPSDQPDYDTTTQNLTEGTPELISGVWTQTWAVTDANADAIAARQAERIENYRRAVQAHVDATAQSKGYETGFALAGYTSSGVPAWKAEAETFVAWRDAVWLYVFELMAQVQAGDAEPPVSTSALIGWLPQIEW
jgi:hypothetical protein